MAGGGALNRQGFLPFHCKGSLRLPHGSGEGLRPLRRHRRNVQAGAQDAPLRPWGIPAIVA